MIPPQRIDWIDRLLARLAERRGIDFRDYRRETLVHGVEMRLAMTGCADAAAYERRLADDETEWSQLARALVVPVTSFFRDPAVFDALAGVIDELVARAPGAVRAWVAGAATGEEAWSLAMLLAERCLPRGIGFDVIGSDLDPGAIAFARRGSYPAGDVASVPAALRARWLEDDGARVRITAPLRVHVRFALHDVMGPTLAPREAIIASFEIVCCRNVLIYFDRRLQHKALERLVAAMAPGGALVLGDTETVPETIAHRLAPHDPARPALRIYRPSGWAVR